MRVLSLISTLLVVGNTAVTAWGADLTKIDRTIAKEPAYKSRPKYCLLVFGPEAKTRVWLVLDGDRLYVDRNGNGDLTDDGVQSPAVAISPGCHPRNTRLTGVRQFELRLDYSALATQYCQISSGLTMKPKTKGK